MNQEQQRILNYLDSATDELDVIRSFLREDFCTKLDDGRTTPREIEDNATKVDDIFRRLAERLESLRLRTHGVMLKASGMPFDEVLLRVRQLP